MSYETGTLQKWGMVLLPCRMTVWFNKYAATETFGLDTLKIGQYIWGYTCRQRD